MKEEEIIKKYEQMIWSIVHKLLKGYSDLDKEDAFQEGIIELLRAHKNFNPEGGAQFITYAHSCIEGVILNTKTRKLKRVSRGSDTMYPEDHINILADTEVQENTERIINLDELQYALSHLDETQRAIVKTYFLDGISVKDLSIECHLSVSRIYQLIEEALEIMKNHINSSRKDYK